MSAVAEAVGNFFGVGPKSSVVLEQWKASAEKKIKDGSYGLHMSQTNIRGNSSREKMVKRADKLLSTISMSLMMDKKEEEEAKDSDNESDESSSSETEQKPTYRKQMARSEHYEMEEPGPSRVTKKGSRSGASKTHVKDLTRKDGSVPKVASAKMLKPSAIVTSDKSEDLDSESEQEKKKSEPVLTKADLIYGKDALKHYKFFASIEKKRKIAELKERLDEKLAQYEWKLEAIDDLVNLARAYYNNPHSEQGQEWKNLKSLVRKKSQRKISETVVRHELSKLPVFKPIFTYLIIVIQVITFGAICAFGGVTYIGVEPRLSLRNGVKTFLGTETIHKWTPPNIWVGPDQRFFIGVGALYPPCMREDYSIQYEYSQRNFSVAEPLGCCEIAIRNTAGTTTEAECRDLTQGIGVWRDGTVCGERESGDNSVAHILKPCCVNLKGTCQLVSHEHCLFLGGIYHKTGLEHCSQVNCLAGICNMGHLESTSDQPWIPANPNQWWRLLISLFYHQGILHVSIVTVIQWLIMRQIEKTSGWFRMALIYIISGIGSLLTASLFETGVAVTGGVGAVFGLLGVMLIELTQFWPIVKRPILELLKILAVIVVFLGLGTLPYLDNFGMIMGLFLGALCAIILLPYVTFRRWQVRVRLILVAVALPCLILIMFVLFYTFFKVQTFEACTVCSFINCIPYTENMCKASLWS